MSWAEAAHGSIPPNSFSGAYPEFRSGDSSPPLCQIDCLISQCKVAKFAKCRGATSRDAMESLVAWNERSGSPGGGGACL